MLHFNTPVSGSAGRQDELSSTCRCLQGGELGAAQLPDALQATQSRANYGAKVVAVTSKSLFSLGNQPCSGKGSNTLTSLKVFFLKGRFALRKEKLVL